VEKRGKRLGWKTNQGARERPMAPAGGDRAESRPPAVGMCSGCAGDYEDPDRTAWGADIGDDTDGRSAGGAGTNEFPAEE
jgi:hypothetical protein